MSTLKNSNFLVLKCYKLAIDLKTIWTNIGRILMTVNIILSFIFLFYFCFFDNKKINNLISSILKNRINSLENNKTQLKKKNIRRQKKNGTENKKSKNSGVKRQNYKKSKTLNKSTKLKAPLKKKTLTNKIKKRIIRNKKNTKNPKIDLNEELHLQNSKRKLVKRNSSQINIVRINNYHIKNLIQGKSNSKHDENISSKSPSLYRASKLNFIMKTYSNDNLEKFNDYSNPKNLNDEELNSLDYDVALLIDKRTYFQYYWSLLKRKQLILFTFIPANDYNLFSVKICLFLLSFSLYFTINGFFFSDETMHKIHEDKGKFNIVYQIPQILYSTIITAIINMILKQLSLSEKNIIAIKQEKDIKQMTNYSKRVKICINIKLIVFFILYILFLVFFWYFISCFCAVYRNTQIILIKDTLVSFALSMLYPFGLNLMPGMLRIPALRAQKKDKKCLYKVSTFVALI